MTTQNKNAERFKFLEIVKAEWKYFSFNDSLYPKQTFFFEGSEASPACPCDRTKMEMEHWWNDSDRRKRKYSVEDLPQHLI
jgi:hypothetical protein